MAVLSADAMIRENRPPKGAIVPAPFSMTFFFDPLANKLKNQSL